MEDYHLESNQPLPDKIEKQKIFIIRFLYWGIIIFCVTVIGKFVFPVLLPFMIAFLIAALLNKPINYFSQKTHIKRQFVSLAAVILFFALTTGILFWIFAVGLNSVNHIFSFLPEVFQSFVIPLIGQIFEKIENLFKNVDPALVSVIESDASTLLDTLSSWIIQLSESILSAATGIVSQIPSIFMKTVITIIVTFFITMDFQNMTEYITKHFPQNKLKFVEELKVFLFRTLPKFIISYGIILFMTFIELWIGFKLLKIPYAGVIALAIAVLDILPVLGTGGVLIPWGIIELVLGDFPMAAGIFIIYIVITVIRNIVEPRFIGKQMGLHPVVTLASMLVGLHLFGVVGLFGFPIALSFMKNIVLKNEI